MDGNLISYRDDLKAWWPNYDHAPVKCMQFVQHGMPAIDVLARHCRARQQVVQAGGHAGFWPKRLAEIFEEVYTFEPEPALFECLVKNCTASNVTAFRRGLGANPGRARFKSHVSAGSWRVDPSGETEIELETIDSLHLRRCDAIALDIEGYEVAALEGAQETIASCRPAILAELLPRSAVAIADWLRRRGYLLVERFGRDGIYTWRKWR